MLAAAPSTTAPSGPTLPAAGVMVASPAMVPVTAPTRLGLPNDIHSITIHTKVAVAAERCVVSIAMPASALEASALPALKPNQPTQSSGAPTITIQGACGGRTDFGKSTRGLSIQATTRAETPAVTCTTMPPAKSITPRLASQPPPHTQWATGT